MSGTGQTTELQSTAQTTSKLRPAGVTAVDLEKQQSHENLIIGGQRLSYAYDPHRRRSSVSDLETWFVSLVNSIKVAVCNKNVLLFVYNGTLFVCIVLLVLIFAGVNIGGTKFRKKTDYEGVLFQFASVLVFISYYFNDLLFLRLIVGIASILFIIYGLNVGKHGTIIIDNIIYNFVFSVINFKHAAQLIRDKTRQKLHGVHETVYREVFRGRMQRSMVKKLLSISFVREIQQGSYFARTGDQIDGLSICIDGKIGVYTSRNNETNITNITNIANEANQTNETNTCPNSASSPSEPMQKLTDCSTTSITSHDAAKEQNRDNLLGHRNVTYHNFKFSVKKSKDRCVSRSMNDLSLEADTPFSVTAASIQEMTDSDELADLKEGENTVSGESTNNGVNSHSTHTKPEIKPNFVIEPYMFIDSTEYIMKQTSLESRSTKRRKETKWAVDMIALKDSKYITWTREALSDFLENEENHQIKVNFLSILLSDLAEKHFLR